MHIRKWIGILATAALVILTCACTPLTSPVPSTTASQSSGIISTAIWRDLGEGQSDVRIMYGFPGILGIASNANATYKQVGVFLAKSVSYTKSVPKSGTKPYIEYAGYLGPPVLTISNKRHKVIINPAWYVETPGGGNFKVKHVSGVLEVNVDGYSTFIQSKAFYDWMYNNKWQSSFHN
jgi:hypothetical protein